MSKTTGLLEPSAFLSWTEGDMLKVRWAAER